MNFFLFSFIDKGIHNVSNYFCPNLTSLDKESLYGDWDSKESTRIYIKVSICNSDRTQCKDPKEINKKIDKQIILMDLLTTQVDYSITNYEKPLVTKLKLKYVILNTKQFINEDLRFSKYELTDDRGTVISDEIITTTEGMTKTEMHFDFRDNMKDPKDWISRRDEFVYWGDISYSNQKVIISRTYTKFFDIIGNVYGMGEIVVFFVMFFYSFYSKIRLNTYICMRLKGNKTSLNKIEKVKSLNKLDCYFSKQETKILDRG